MFRSMDVRVGLVVALCACGVLRFEVEEEASTEIRGAGLLGSVLGAVDLGELDDFDVTIEQALADQGVEPGDLRSVALTSFTLEGSPDLGFLAGLAVYVSADGVPEVRVASVGDVPDGATTATLEVDAVDLVEHVVAGGVVFRIDAAGDAPRDDTAVTARVSAEVSATPQGACRAARGDRGDQPSM